MSNENPSPPSIRDNPMIRKIREHMRVTKIVCTRSVKGKFGDNYVGFSAAWDTIQDDSGGGGDMISASSEAEIRLSNSQIGMTLKEAKLAALILGMQADIAAHDHASASGNITQEQRNAAVQAIKANFSQLIVDSLGGGGGEVKNGG